MKDIAVGRKNAVPKLTEVNTISFGIYLREVSKFKTISSEEETELIKRAQSGDEEAKQKLIQAHLRFVISVAKRYSGLGVPIEDLISEGNIGLLEAVEHYDSSYGFKFLSYAVFRIRQKILAFLRENTHIVKYPQNLVILSMKISNKIDEFIRKNGYSPTLEDLKNLLGNKHSIQSIAWAIKLKYGYDSLERPINTDEPSYEQRRVIDLVEDEEQNMNEIIDKDNKARIINEVLDKYLNPEEANLIRMRFGIGRSHPMSLCEIAETLNRSQNYIEEKLKSVMQKLKRNWKAMEMLRHCL